MDKNYAILHVRRVKTAAHLAQLELHCKRRLGDPSRWLAAPEMTGENVVKGDDWVELRKKLMDEVSWVRKPQRNAAVAIEWVITASRLDKSDTTLQYMVDAINWIQRQGALVLSLAVHWDETTPHIHIYTLPTVRTQDGKYRYSADALLGDKQHLSQLQDRFWQDVGRRFGLDRGELTQGRSRPNKSLSDYQSRQSRQSQQQQQRRSGWSY